MNRVSLDSIGIAGFGHDFGTLDGRPCDVADVFESFSDPKQASVPPLFWAFASMFPWLMNIPSPRNLLIDRLHKSMAVVSKGLLQRTKQETVGSGTKSEKSYSIIGAVGTSFVGSTFP
jgi:hypothetical protein